MGGVGAGLFFRRMIGFGLEPGGDELGSSFEFMEELDTERFMSERKSCSEGWCVPPLERPRV